MAGNWKCASFKIMLLKLCWLKFCCWNLGPWNISLLMHVYTGTSKKRIRFKHYGLARWRWQLNRHDAPIFFIDGWRHSHRHSIFKSHSGWPYQITTRQSSSSFNFQNDVGHHCHCRKSVISHQFKVWWRQTITSIGHHQIVIFIKVFSDGNP